MPSIRSTLSRFPRLSRFAKSVYSIWRGEPPITFSEVTQELIQACVSKPNPILLEIGCNNGGHTLWFSDMFETASIYCFEPDPRAIARFKRRVGTNSQVKLFEIALSDHRGEITFYQSDGHHNEKQAKDMPEGYDKSGSIKKPKESLKVHPWLTFENTIKVKTTTLDDWCEDHQIDTIDFIWMDVQGAEMDVFKGGERFLPNVRFIYTEYSNREMYEGQASLNQILRYLKDFKVLVRYPSDVLLYNTRFDFHPDNLQKEGLLRSSRHQ